MIDSRTSILLRISAAVLLPLLLCVGARASRAAPVEDCPIHEETKYVSGDSMRGLFEPEEPILAQSGYYACHEPSRGDAVLVDFVGNKRPLLKLVQVIPGDRFELRPMERSERSGAAADPEYNIYVNGEVLQTVHGRRYVFSGKAYKMLSLFEKDFGGVMRAGTYFVFGTQEHGSLDSTRFGPVERKALTARVVRATPQKKKKPSR